MKGVLLNVVGKILHKFVYKSLPSNIENVFIMMGGPSLDSEKESLSKKWSLSITANLTDPSVHMNRVNASLYVHCFSDPSILSNKGKFSSFKKIVRFSRRHQYLILVPTNYLKSWFVFVAMLKGEVKIYNQNYSFQNNGIVFEKYSYPNMNTIFLDCALPLAVYSGAKSIYVSGFDANYGIATSKQYSTSVMPGSMLEVIDNSWSDVVQNNAELIITIVKAFSDTDIVFSHHSGFYRFLEKRGNLSHE